MEITTLKSLPRDTIGTRAARALRAAGRLPAIIYGHGEAPESVSLLMRDVEEALARGARMLPVEVGGKGHQFLIKAVQYDHLDAAPIHLDLTRVSMDERVKVYVGIELRGVPKGVADGGVLDQHLAGIEVECLVASIPDTLHPLVTDLELGASLLVKDLELPDGVVPLADPEDRVATVRAVAEEVEAEEPEGDEKEAAVPERIGRIRKDDEPADKAKK